MLICGITNIVFILCETGRLFASKQSREVVDLPLTCHLSPSLTTFAFRSSEVSRLLLDFDPYGGTDPLGMLRLLRELMLWPPVLV